MGVVVVIPARGGSEGVPRKNLQPIGGVPLVGWAVRAARSAKCVEAVYVSTDDDEIADAAAEFGAEVIVRPPSLAESTTPVLPVIRHALDWLEAVPSRVVVLQCTNPFTTGDDIDRAVALADSTDADVVVGTVRDHSFLWHVFHGQTVGVNFDPAEPVLRRQDFIPQWRTNGSLFVARTSGLSSAVSLMSGRVVLYEMPAERSIDIDTPLDLHIAKALLAYQRQWIVLGSSPSAPEWLPVVRARYPDATTITTNSGGLLFESPERPNYYFLSDSNACEYHGELAQDLSRRGAITITRRRDITALQRRGVEWFDEFIQDERPGTMAGYHAGYYCDCGLSGLFCLQYALNHGALGVHLVGFEGYGDGQHYWDKPDCPPTEKNKGFTTTHIEPFVQSAVERCPEVQFHFYGDLNYRVSGSNVSCESNSSNGGEVSRLPSSSTSRTVQPTC